MSPPNSHDFRKMLYIVGLGLSDEKDITVKGLEAIKSCERVYLEAYTSVLIVSKEKLVNIIIESFERFYLFFKFNNGKIF